MVLGGQGEIRRRLIPYNVMVDGEHEYTDGYFLVYLASMDFPERTGIRVERKKEKTCIISIIIGNGTGGIRYGNIEQKKVNKAKANTTVPLLHSCHL